MDDESWNWGPADRAAVDTCLHNEEDGSFVVFHDQGTDYHVLAYRQNDRNIYKDILFRDHYYGFTEPLGFESLAELINAFNWSPATEGLLVNPIPRPYDMGEDDVSPIELLLRIRDNERHITERSEEVDAIVSQIQQIERTKEELLNAIDGLNKVCRMIDIQIERHNTLNLRRTSGSLPGSSTYISDNYSLLLDRQCKVQSSKKEKEDREVEVEQTRRDLLQEYSTCMFAINSIHEQQAEDKRLLLRNFPQLREFVEYLLQDLPLVHPGPLVHDIRAGEADKRLKGGSTGTFLVRISRKAENIPFVFSVCLDDTVVHFPVYKMDGYYGFNETMCIFETLEDITNKYAVIPFRLHGEQYDDLTLVQELLN